jgi:hypothetical protein
MSMMPDVKESSLGGIFLIPQNELPVGDRPQHIIPPLEDSIVPPAVLLSLLVSQPVNKLARWRARAASSTLLAFSYIFCE